MEDFLQTIGQFLTNLGYFLMPISLISYAVIRFLEIFISRDIHIISRGTKVIWYIAAFVEDLSPENRFLTIATLMIIMDLIDTVCELFEEAIEKQQSNKKEQEIISKVTHEVLVKLNERN